MFTGLLFLAAAGCGPIEESSAAAAPGVRVFLGQHQQFGTVQSTAPLPDWAQGQRQTVRTTTGSYVFYFQNGEVVTVRDGERPDRILWQR